MSVELEHWYDASKTLVFSGEEAEDEASVILEMGRCKRQLLAVSKSVVVGSSGEARAIWPTSVEQGVYAFWAVPEVLPRYERLKKVLVEKYTFLSGGECGGGEQETFRGIVSVRQRVTMDFLAHVIASDPTIAALFRTAYLYASSAPATASIERFRRGLMNILIATDVTEEGMDKPAANCTSRFDAIEHAVSLVQTRECARQVDSSFVVLSERADRTTGELEAVEHEQLRLVHSFLPIKDGAGSVGQDALLAAQRSREREARSVLAARAKLDYKTVSTGVLSAVNLFATKTKVVLEYHYGSAHWIYESSLRELPGVGEASGKEVANKKATEALVAELLAALPAR